MRNYRLLAISLSLLTFVGISSCDEEEKLIEERLSTLPPEEKGDPGSADFSKYVSLGNSLTAGFTDGALYPAGQSFSYPAIVASQLQLAGGGTFTQPPISQGDGFGGVNADMSLRGRSYINTTPGAPPTEAILFKAGSALVASSVATSDLNNFGVPGARVVDAVTAGYGNFNPFYAKFQSSGSASMLSDAMSANATFFSVWLGSNDVLGYALDGGAAGEAFDPVNPKTMTSVSAFTAAFTAVLDGMGQDNTQGVVLNIPPITISPYFQIITTLAGGHKLIPLSADQATALNSAYAGYNGALGIAFSNGLITEAEKTKRTITWVAGANAPVITDESLTDLTAAISPAVIKMRQADANDRYPLPALGIIGTLADPGNANSVYGVGVPIPDKYTLTFSEQVAIITRTAQFNGVISALVGTRTNLSIVDTHPVFADLFGLSTAQATGLGLSAAGIENADGVLGLTYQNATLVPLSLSASSLFSSVFSSDGLHPNAQGSALIANEIINAINTRFDASVISANVLTYPTIRIN